MIKIKCYFRSKPKIEFRDLNDFNQILLTHSVAPHEPGALYAVTPSTLLYVDSSKSPTEIHRLDLSESQPKPTAWKRFIHIKQNYILDMCCSQDGDKELLIVTEIDGLFAYNTNTNKLEWKVDRKPPGMEKDIYLGGVTTDKRGHLFVGGNKCIHLFKASDGQYLGCLVKDDKELGVPARIHWCDKTSSLTTVCEFKDKWHINVISVQF